MIFPLQVLFELRFLHSTSTTTLLSSWIWNCSWRDSCTSRGWCSWKSFLHRNTSIQSMSGSRLIAFELVHDKIPATLIADSAATALMKTGQVDAVIVGADRVVANGDTANKIRTYSLTVCAMHHGIPFYVAAPLTSFDLSLFSGHEIVIEERSAKELLHARGGLGEQIAASGISVWNPAFDVTQANIISGIITEKVSHSPSLSHGVITKDGSDSFDIKSFIQKVFSKQ